MPATFRAAGVSTSRFRLFCSARPGASVHTRQMLKRVPAATVISNGAARPCRQNSWRVAASRQRTRAGARASPGWGTRTACESRRIPGACSAPRRNQRSHPCRAAFWVLLISVALSSAALGFACPRLWRSIRAPTPHTRPRTARPCSCRPCRCTPVEDRVPRISVTRHLHDFADRMSVPGATTSGLTRRSVQGPRLLKAAIASGDPKWFRWAMGSSGNDPGHAAP